MGIRNLRDHSRHAIVVRQKLSEPIYEENIRLVESGRLVIPDGADVVTFLLSDGKLNGTPTPPKSRLLGQLFDEYLESLPDGALESNSLCTVQIHMRHFRRILESRFAIQNLSVADLQRYVERRSKQKGRRGQSLSPRTIKKELATLSSVWTWARLRGYVSQTFPRNGIRFPKTQEKPPFQTWDKIARQIARGGLSETEEADRWDSLFLSLSQIEEVLEFVRSVAGRGFVYPMFVTAAHTGARRSELIRSRLDDFDLELGIVWLRECKRIKGRRSIRTVPLSPKLLEVIVDWMTEHPGGNFTFCDAGETARGRTSQGSHGSLSVGTATTTFRSTLRNSKWDKLHGWHVFRHSFASNCALKGVKLCT